MTPAFDIRTAYLMLGVLSLASAYGSYVTLRASAHRGNIHWVMAGVAFGLGCLLLSLRSQVADALTYELAHALMAGSFCIHVAALRHEAGARARPLLGWGLAFASTAVFAFVRHIEPLWGMAYFSLMVLFGSAAVVVAASALWRLRRQQGSALVALAYAVLGAGMLVRLAHLAQADGSNPFQPGVNQVILQVAGFFAVVLGQVGYLGLQFERMVVDRIASERQSAMLAERTQQTLLREAALNARVEERNQLIQRIARSETASALALFATALPHELSQPLCASKLQLEGVLARLERDRADPMLIKAVRSADASNDRVLQLLQQLRILLLAHEDADQAPVDLVALVRQTLPILEGSFRDGAVALESALGDEPVRVRASLTQLQQLLLILCTNALSVLVRMRAASDRAPRVRVSLSVAGGQARLCVEDSGPGYTPAAPASLLEPYVPDADRFDAGLTVARRIAQAHHGRLEIGGGTLGGAAFTVSLPLQARAQRPQ